MGILNGKTAVVTGSTSGIGRVCAKAFAGGGANVVINGVGAPDDIEKARAAIEREFAVKAIYSPADMTKPREIGWLIAHTERPSAALTSWSTMPASSTLHRSRTSPPRMGCDHRDQPVRRLPSHPRGRARHEEARLGPHHHHRFGTFNGRLALQVGLCRGQARHRETKTVALLLARSKITCNCISPGYVWTPLVEKQIPNTMAARRMRRDEVISDVLLAAQPKDFVTVDQVASLALFLCSDDAAQITGANLSMDGGWTAA